jgi:hypothetical protein
MRQISLRFWKAQTSGYQLNFAIWLHVAVEWAGLGVSGVLDLVDVMQAMVDGMARPTVEGMVVGAPGGYQKELVAVVLTVTPEIVTGMAAVSTMMRMLMGATIIGSIMKGWFELEMVTTEAEVEAQSRSPTG